MKSTGIVRKIDDLGRIVLPIELRRTLDIGKDDPVEIYVEGSSVILKKYEPTCVFCGSIEDVKSFKEKNICAECIASLNK
jgi:transcriptional pleiotropic regulator of transition state genes